MQKIYPFSFYFLYFAAMVSMMPFLVLFYQQLGFSGAQIGILTGIAPLIILFSAPFWSGLADARRKHRLVMSIGFMAAVVTGIVFPFLRAFSVILLVYSLFTFFISPIMPLGDAATIASLGEEKSKYGRLRVGGTLGWALFAPLIGYLVERFGLSMSFWSYAILMFLGLLVSQRFTFPEHGGQAPLRQGLRQFVTDRRWLVFLGTSALAGLGLVTISNYLFAYMKELQASESIMGFSLTLSTLMELPVLFFANKLLQRFGSVRLLRISIFLTSLRMLIFVLFNSVPGILLGQLLNGVNYPLFLAAGVAYADDHAPAGMRSTAQGLFSAVSMGIGSAIGGLLGGLLLDAAGSRGMFFTVGLVLAGGTLLLIGADWLVSRRSGPVQPQTVE